MLDLDDLDDSYDFDDLSDVEDVADPGDDDTEAHHDPLPNLADDFLHLGGLPPVAVDVLWQHARFTGRPPKQAPSDDTVELLAASIGNRRALHRLGGALDDPDRIRHLAAHIDDEAFLDGLARNPATPRDLATSNAWRHGTELQRARAEAETTGDPALAERHRSARRLAELLVSPGEGANRARLYTDVADGHLRHQVIGWLRRDGQHPLAAELLSGWFHPAGKVRLGANDIAEFLSPPNAEARLDLELYAAGDLDEAVPEAPGVLSALACRLTGPAAVYGYTSDDPLGQLLAAWSNTALGSHLRWTQNYRRPPGRAVRFPDARRRQPPPVDLELARAVGTTPDALAALATDDPRTPAEDLVPALAGAGPRAAADWLSGLCPHRPRPGDVQSVAAALNGSHRTRILEDLGARGAFAENRVDGPPWAVEIARELTIGVFTAGPVSLPVAAMLYDAALDGLGTQARPWAAAFALLERFTGTSRDWIAASLSVSV